jgi:uncharacterized protein (DUF433 family)
MNFSRITVDPDICLGQPTIRGTRITASVILKLLATENSYEKICEYYPELEVEDIRQATEYAAWVISDRSIALV